MLTAREREVLILRRGGAQQPSDRPQADIAERTVKSHLHNIFQRLGVTHRTEAALWAQRNLRSKCRGACAVPTDSARGGRYATALDPPSGCTNTPDPSDSARSAVGGVTASVSRPSSVQALRPLGVVCCSAQPRLARFRFGGRRPLRRRRRHPRRRSLLLSVLPPVGGCESRRTRPDSVPREGTVHVCGHSQLHR